MKPRNVEFNDIQGPVIWNKQTMYTWYHWINFVELKNSWVNMYDTEVLFD